MTTVNIDAIGRLQGRIVQLETALAVAEAENEDLRDEHRRCATHAAWLQAAVDALGDICPECGWLFAIEGAVMCQLHGPVRRARGLQPCGHPLDEVVSSGRGHWCRICEDG